MLDIIFPITSGIVIGAFESGFADSGEPYCADVHVAADVPVVKVSRMVTVRDDSGPDDGVQTRRRHGVNVWADDSVDAEHLALYAMALARRMPDGKPVTLTDQFSGPFKITDDPPFTVDGVTLHHFFFTFRLTARGTNFIP